MVGATADGDGGRGRLLPSNWNVQLLPAAGALETIVVNGTAVGLPSGVTRTSHAPRVSLVHGLFTTRRMTVYSTFPAGSATRGETVEYVESTVVPNGLIRLT